MRWVDDVNPCGACDLDDRWCRCSPCDVAGSERAAAAEDEAKMRAAVEQSKARDYGLGLPATERALLRRKMHEEMKQQAKIDAFQSTENYPDLKANEQGVTEGGSGDAKSSAVSVSVEPKHLPARTTRRAAAVLAGVACVGLLFGVQTYQEVQEAQRETEQSIAELTERINDPRASAPEVSGGSSDGGPHMGEVLVVGFGMSLVAVSVGAVAYANRMEKRQATGRAVTERWPRPQVAPKPVALSKKGRRALLADLRARHLTVETAYGQYETSLLEVFHRPLLADVRVAATGAFHAARKDADSAYRVVRQSLDAGLLDRYAGAVSALESAWAAANVHASEVGLGYLSEPERKRVNRAAGLLALVLDGALSEQARQEHYDKVVELVKGLIVMPEPARKALESTSRIALPAGVGLDGA